MTVKPQYSIDNAPAPDIIVFPGGDSGPSSKDPKVLKWAQTKSSAGTLIMTVCTGAFILANADMLDDLSVTTHHSALVSLQNKVPSATVLSLTRFVDNGNIVTTAGVSAGIDGALHMVARIKGVEVSKATAHYMEYDKWNPEDGKTVYQNPYLSNQGNFTKDTPIPFEGEIVDVSRKWQEEGSYQSSTLLLDKGIKWYPNSGAMYNLLSHAYTKLGKPAPMVESSFMKIIDAGNFDEALDILTKLKNHFPDGRFSQRIR